MLGEDRCGDLCRLCLCRIAILLRIACLQGVFQFAGVVLGDLDMALLMALDVGRQRVPEQPYIGIGLSGPAPFRQDHLDLDGHDRGGDPAGTRLRGVADTGREGHLCGAGVARAGAFDLRPMFGKLLLDILQRAAADGKVAVCLDEIGRAGGEGGRSKHQRAEQGSFHHVASRSTLLYGHCRRNGIDPLRITHP